MLYFVSVSSLSTAWWVDVSLTYLVFNTFMLASSECLLIVVWRTYFFLYLNVGWFCFLEMQPFIELQKICT